MSATYRRPMPFLENSGLSLFANTNFNQQDKYFSGGGFVTRTTWNLRLGVEGETRGVNWQLQGFWNNWTDRQDDLSRTALGKRLTDPATYGIRLNLRGGEGNN